MTILTTSRGFHYPDAAELPNGPAQFQQLAQDVNAQWTSGTFGARPAADPTKTGRRYYATDVPGGGVGTEYIDLGTAWVPSGRHQHQANHLPGGNDALPWSTIHGSGLHASRPAAATT